MMKIPRGSTRSVISCWIRPPTPARSCERMSAAAISETASRTAEAESVEHESGYSHGAANFQVNVARSLRVNPEPERGVDLDAKLVRGEHVDDVRGSLAGKLDLPQVRSLSMSA